MSKIRQSKTLQEFKAFISRGNVVDLAIGVIIGGAFGKIVSSLVADIITPLISILIGGINFSDLAVTIPNYLNPDSPVRLTYGNFIQNVVNFLVIALSIFFMIRLINKANAKAHALAQKLTKKDTAKATIEAAETAAKTQATEDEQTKLLREIRDALTKKPRK